jgi:ABC-type nitrate/sulfonate/bicarbonate transport system permease component
MARTHTNRFHLYTKKWHILFAFSVIALPLLFFVGFSRFTDIALSSIFANIGISVTRLFVAYAIAAVLGWGCAVLFYRGKISTVMLPVFDVLQSVPTFAALPIAVLAWGKTNFTVIFFLVLAIIWPIFFSVLSSLRMVRGDYEEAVQIYGLRGWKKVRYFLFPASIHGLVTGSIVGLGDAWEALITTEIIVGLATGLGSFFQLFSSNAEITLFGIVGLLLVIFTINKMIWLPLLEKSHSLAEE